MLENACATYFVADYNEVLKSNSFDDLVRLVCQYEEIISFDFQAVYSLSQLFFSDDEHIPKDIQKIIIDDGSTIFQCEDDFVRKVASFETEELDSLAYIWRDKYWRIKKHYEGMGIWVHLFQLNAVCKLAIKENKNLYILVEKE